MAESDEPRSRSALGLLIAVLAAAGLWFVLGHDEAGAPVVRGAPAPDFTLARHVAGGGASDGSSGELSLDALRGRVVLVNFWATWCEPCEREMPAMQRLYARLPRDRFELVAISIDEEPEKIDAFVERYALTFPILVDPGKKVATTYQTMGVPESLLVDPEGRIVERYVGPREWDAPEYVGRIEALVEAGAGGGAPFRDAAAGSARAPAP
ncbi:MAG: TlpA disulfide reductase family protein [Myxococcota bacterium]